MSPLQANWRQTALHRMREAALTMGPPSPPSTLPFLPGILESSTADNVSYPSLPSVPSANTAVDDSVEGNPKSRRWPPPDERSVATAGLPVRPVQGLVSDFLYRRCGLGWVSLFESCGIHKGLP